MEANKNIILWLPLLLFACSPPVQNQEQPPGVVVKTETRNDTLFKKVEVTVHDTVHIYDTLKLQCSPNKFLFYEYGYDPSYLSPGAFNIKTLLFQAPKAGSGVVDTVPFGTPFNIISSEKDFFQVCYRKGKSAYARKEDVYLHNVHDSYYVGLGWCYTDNPNLMNNCVLKVKRYNEQEKKIEVLTDSICSMQYSLKPVNDVALKNAGTVFHIDYLCMSEIGKTCTKFILNNGKWVSLITAESSGDGGWSGESKVYLPVYLQNSKKIIFAKNGDLTVDPVTGKAELFPYPEKCGIPAEELVIVEDVGQDNATDKDGNTVYDKYGAEVKRINFLEITYYRWNGTSLKKVKSIPKIGMR